MKCRLPSRQRPFLQSLALTNPRDLTFFPVSALVTPSYGCRRGIELIYVPFRYGVGALAWRCQPLKVCGFTLLRAFFHRTAGPAAATKSGLRRRIGKA